ALYHASAPLDLIGQRFSWKTNGADVAANLGAVAAAEESWAINRVGYATGDVRTQGNATDHDVYVHMKGGADPNGKRIYTSSSRMLDIGGGKLTDVKVIGHARKDGFHGRYSSTGKLITVERFEHIDFPA